VQYKLADGEHHKEREKGDTHEENRKDHKQTTVIYI